MPWEQAQLSLIKHHLLSKGVIACFMRTRSVAAARQASTQAVKSPAAILPFQMGCLSRPAPGSRNAPQEVLLLAASACWPHACPHALDLCWATCHRHQGGAKGRDRAHRSNLQRSSTARSACQYLHHPAASAGHIPKAEGLVPYTCGGAMAWELLSWREQEVGFQGWILVSASHAAPALTLFTPDSLSVGMLVSRPEA